MQANKKLSCRREAARRFMSLKILLSHSRSFEMTLLNRACVSPYQYSIETMSVVRIVFEIFSVKEWRDLETGGRGHLKWRRSILYDFLLVRHFKYSSTLYRFYRASAHWRARYWYSNSVSLFVRLFVSPSVTFRYQMKDGLTYRHSFFSPYEIPIILVLSASNIFTKFRRGHRLRGW